MKLFPRLRLFVLVRRLESHASRIALALERLADAAERDSPPRRKPTRPTEIGTLDVAEVTKRWRADRTERMLDDEEAG